MYFGWRVIYFHKYLSKLKFEAKEMMKGVSAVAS
jgi:hypothetical protein